MTAADWRARGACAQGINSELFFPEGDRGRAYERQVAAAKRVCAGCLVRAECLAFALRALPYGMAGGLAPEERRGLPRTGRRVVPPVELPARASRADVAAAGREALRAGHDVDAVARMCQVTKRTVERWATRLRDEMGAVA